MVLGAVPVYFLIKYLLKIRNKSKEEIVSVEKPKEEVDTNEETNDENI